MSQYTPAGLPRKGAVKMEIKDIVKTQREYFDTGETLGMDFRIAALKKLAAEIDTRTGDVLSAIKADLGRQNTEAFITEIAIVKHELKYFIKHLKTWTKKRKVKSTLMMFPSKSYQVAEPYGVTLIMSPWNYPFLLTVQPLIASVAAGNCAVVKPAAYSPHMSDLIYDIVTKCFAPAHVTVVRGSRQENEQLLDQKFDYIFFTGSVAVGRYVMERASKNLTPVTLELGGKSPVIIDESAKIDIAAKRLVFGKFINCGQTCVAPDYVLVHKSREEELLAALKKYIDLFYPKDGDGVIADYPRMINEKHFMRVCGLIDKDKVYCGGGNDAGRLHIEPTVMRGVTGNDAVMQEEIFGPVLPVITYENLSDALIFIKQRPKPLALYLFSENRAVWDTVERSVSFGGGAINDCLVQLSSHHLPFGGVGESGMGSYHGRAGFDTFTHYKSILNKSTKLDIAARYRPYSEAKNKIIMR